MGGGRRSKREGIYVYMWLVHFIVQHTNNTRHLYSPKIKQIKKIKKTI